MFGKNSSGENDVTGATVESIAWTMHPVGEGSIVELSTGVIRVPIKPILGSRASDETQCTHNRYGSDIARCSGREEGHSGLWE